MSDSAAPMAERILEESGIGGGLIVHLNCGEGKLTAALGSGERYTVQGLEADAEEVEAARRHIRQLGRYGRVSVDHRDRAARLPYADNLVNLLVVSGPTSASRVELERVLCPGGVAIFATRDRGSIGDERLTKRRQVGTRGGL